jgi:hypothetical protein
VKFLMKCVFPVLAVLWLARVHPLGAVVMVLICIIRYSFKSHVFSHLFSHFIYDVLKFSALGFARLFSRRRRN